MNNGDITNNSKLFEESAIELIKRRRSVRTYSERPVAAEIRDRILQSVKQMSGPFDVKVRFELIYKEEIKRDEKLNLGTYGMITGANSFLVAVAEKSQYSMLQVGYLFELLVLHCTSLGLGTCWMAGTFNRDKFFKAVKVQEHEFLPIVSPVGYASSRRSPVDMLIKPSLSVKQRKPWEKLFYQNDFDHPLTEEDAGKYALPLEMVRLAPSAANRQPWRIVKTDECFHFYLTHPAWNTKRDSYDVARVDLGIAMCHFETAAKELGLTGRWEVQNKSPFSGRAEFEYIVSWVLNYI